MNTPKQITTLTAVMSLALLAHSIPPNPTTPQNLFLIGTNSAVQASPPNLKIPFQLSQYNLSNDGTTLVGISKMPQHPSDPLPTYVISNKNNQVIPVPLAKNNLVVSILNQTPTFVGNNFFIIEAATTQNRPNGIIEATGQTVTIAVSTTTGHIQKIPALSQMEVVRTYSNPNQPQVAVVGQINNKNVIVILDKNFNQTKVIQTPAIINSQLNGDGFIIYNSENIYQFNWNNLQITQIQGKWEASAPSMKNSIKPRYENATVSNTRLKLRPLYLHFDPEIESTTHPLFLSAEGANPVFNADRTAVAYTTPLGIVTQSLTSVERVDALKNLKEIVKSKAMTQLKQVGTSILIYTSDYDALLPTAQDWQDKINPYIKNYSLFENVSYLGVGEDTNLLEDPSTYPVAIIRTEFGNAIANADGSVIWVDKP